MKRSIRHVSTTSDHESALHKGHKHSRVVYPSTPHKKEQPLYHSYEYAQKLNNNAALCIEYGQYERAENTLSKALILSKAHIEETKKQRLDICRSYHCTLDGCVTFTEDSHRAWKATMVSAVEAQNSSKDDDSDPLYIHKRAIRVPCLKISDDGRHNMGPLLSLIIAFNLGLARHLRALKDQNTILLEKSLHLYRVASNCIDQHCQQNHIEKDDHSFLQFRLILCNNLCHIIHCLKSKNNSSLHQKEDREQLLSTLICLVDQQTSDSKSEENRSAVASLVEESSSPQKKRLLDLEGFWKTATPFVLNAQCADAA